MFDVSPLSASILNKSTAEAFFAAVEAKAAALTDPADRARWLRSAYSFWNNSVNLVSRRSCEAIRRSHPPDFTDWRDGRALFGRELPAAPRALLPGDAVIRRTLTSWVDLARQGAMASPPSSHSLYHRNLFIAAGLELACGLRAGEVAQARWGWWQKHSHGPLLCADSVAVKNNTGRLEVVPVNPFWSVLNYWIDRHGWRGGPDDFCLAVRHGQTIKQGNLRFRRALPSALNVECSMLNVSAFRCESDRLHRPARWVSEWLRALGWQTQRTNHALRDYVASLLTMRYTLKDAQAWCRHSSYRTTERSYNRFVTLARRVSPHKLRWLNWAK